MPQKMLAQLENVMKMQPKVATKSQKETKDPGNLKVVKLEELSCLPPLVLSVCMCVYSAYFLLAFFVAQIAGH